MIFDPKDPYLWIFFSALCCGLWLGRLPLLFHRRQRLWMRWTTGGAVFLSLGILLFGAALFAPLGGLFTDSPPDVDFLASFEWLPFFLGALLAGALGGRFPREAGIPLGAMIVLTAVTTALALDSFHPLPEGPSMEYRILRVDDDSTVVRLGFGDGKEIITTLQGRDIFPVVEQISAPDYFFILPKKRLYRIPWLKGDNPTVSMALPIPSDRHRLWGNLLAWAAKTLPVLTYREYPATAEELLPRLSYGLYFDENYKPHMELMENWNN